MKEVTKQDAIAADYLCAHVPTIENIRAAYYTYYELVERRTGRGTQYHEWYGYIEKMRQHAVNLYYKEPSALHLLFWVKSHSYTVSKLLMLHQYEEAERLMLKVMKQGEKLIAMSPFVEEVYAVDEFCCMVYDYLRSDRRLEEGVEYTKKLIALIEDALSKESDELVFLCHRGNCYKVALDMRDLGNEEETRVYAEKMLQYAKISAERYPKRRTLVGVCNGHLELGKSLEKLGRTEEAVKLYAEGEPYAKRLYDMEQDEVTYGIWQEFRSKKKR